MSRCQAVYKKAKPARLWTHKRVTMHKQKVKPAAYIQDVLINVSHVEL